VTDFLNCGGTAGRELVKVWADSGYRGAQRRVNRDDLQWHIAGRPSDIAKMPEGAEEAQTSSNTG
jgi:IS5 family transposase